MASKNKSEFKASECTVLHFYAGQTPNGNSRKVYVVLHLSGKFVASIDDDGRGSFTLEDEFGKAIWGDLRKRVVFTVETTKKQYREFLKDFGRDGTFRGTLV